MDAEVEDGFHEVADHPEVLRRPGTAPVSSSDWTQVHALVKTLLGDVAFNVANRDLPDRPHTACAGARLSHVVLKDVDDEDAESDGGSLDLDESEARKAIAVPTNNATGHAPKTEDGPSLSRGEWLLLSGLAGKASSKASSSKDVRATSACSEESRPKEKILPPSLGEKLPRSRMLQVGRCGGMAPQASRLKSHTSWTSFLPISSKDQRTAGRAHLAPTPQTESFGYPENKNSESDLQAQIARSSADVHREVPRQTGPKYRVLPGGSRPESKAKKAKEIVVLEFRSEPRVVPARRLGQDTCSQRRGQKKSESTPMHRFRQDDGLWALEREALANV